MNEGFHGGVLEATRLTRAGRIAEATAILQRVLRGVPTPDAMPGPAGGPRDARAPGTALMLDVTPESVRTCGSQPAPEAKPDLRAGSARRAPVDARSGMRQAWGSVLGPFQGMDPGIGMTGLPGRAVVQAPVADGALFIAASYGDQAGSRTYKLYLPSTYRGQRLSLVVMLHGCTQSPDDFAAGTRMNELAEEHGCFIVYPAQASTANIQKCWNWFVPGDQQHGQGEPALIAGITRQVMREYAVDSRRVFIAGLSAGGAAAAIMGAVYPDLYAAVGVHSGLACGCASDVPSAFAAMRHGGSARRPSGPAGGVVPTIVFHGDRDKTVDARNGDHVIAQVAAGMAGNLEASVERGQVPGGHAYSRTRYAARGSAPVLEQWLIHGAGHAWAGGSADGSFTDPRGPDASREMLRFFREHPHAQGE